MLEWVHFLENKYAPLSYREMLMLQSCPYLNNNKRLKGNGNALLRRDHFISVPIRGICSAFDGIFLYNRSNNTKNDVKIFIPIDARKA